MAGKNRKKGGKKGKKSPGSGQSNASPSPSTATPTPSAPVNQTPTSTTVSDELITPGALNLRLQQVLDPINESTDGTVLVEPKSADQVMSPESSPDPATEDVEYQRDIPTPTQANPQPETTRAETPEPAEEPIRESIEKDTTMAGATAAAAAAATAAEGSAMGTEQTSNNPFRNPSISPRSSRQMQPTVEESTFDDVPLGPTDPAPAPAAKAQKTEDEIPTPPATTPKPNPLASPVNENAPGNPFMAPGSALEYESLEEYRARTHLGYDQPRPSEPFMQSNAVPDAAPTDNFVSNGGANQPTTEENQNLWAPGTHGFERETGAPRKSSVVEPHPVPADAALSSNFVVEDSSSEEQDEVVEFSRDSQPGLWTDAYFASHPEAKASVRSLTPTEGPMPTHTGLPPTSYPGSAGASVDTSPKSLLPDPNVPAKLTLNESAFAPLGAASPIIRPPSDFTSQPEDEDLDGFLNPWTRSAQNLPMNAAPPPIASPTIPDANLSTPALPLSHAGSAASSNPFADGSEVTPQRSNEPLMPTRPFMNKKHLRISNEQLRTARPSVVPPARAGPSKLKRTPSGRSIPSGKGPPPPSIVEADMENIRLDNDPVFPRSGPRERFASLETPAPVFMRMQNQGRGLKSQYERLTVRAKLIIFATIFVVLALILGLAIGLARRNSGGNNGDNNPR